LDLHKEVNELFPVTQSLRRDFHRFPELGFNEGRTSQIIAKELEQLNIKVFTGIGKTGVVGILDGREKGPVLLLRFDMDALAIDEENDVEYTSQNPGVMHACGHDGHMAIGLTLARILSNHRNMLKGTIKFIFQPAEERLQGAKAMIKDGAMKNPEPNFSMGLHLWNEKPCGWFGMIPGPLMAGADRFSIHISGKGGHGANPHLATDSIIAAAHIINSLQSILSRNVPPLESAVLSVTKMIGGRTFNVIPPNVDLEGTIRYFKPEINKRIVERLHTIVDNTAKAFECNSHVDVESLTLPVVNNEDMINLVTEIAKSTLKNIILENDYRTMVSEDMSFFMQDIPGCFILVGSANQDKGLNYKHHHPRFDFDETCLPSAITLLAASCFEILVERK
jgi:amidohydrolase